VVNDTDNAAEAKAAGPLTGVKVLDLSRVLAGPWLGQMLADLGADVIKVERPGKGDEARSYGPPYLKRPDGSTSSENAFYLSANRGKRSIAIDISKPEGAELVRTMAARSDILLENYKVGDLARYGLDYATLSKINPRLIYCSVTGFGQTGPYSARAGYDLIFQGMSGLMSVTGKADDEPGGGPVRVGPSLVDVISGLFSGNAVLAALRNRDMVTGRGQHIDMALMDCAVAVMSHYAQMYLLSGDVPPRRGNQGNGGAPSQLFNCADGAIILTAGNDRQYAALCQVLGVAELIEDPRFRANTDRMANRLLLGNLLERAFLTQPKVHWLPLLEEAGVPAGPINDLAEVFADPQVIERGMKLMLAHPEQPEAAFVASPIRMSESSTRATRPPPRVDEHQAEILSEELGLSAEEISRLKKAGAIQA
jgi:crotonobetainyl-CoA:carnitine CoA-transferase CaiB-like acyl-CoA transferase